MAIDGELLVKHFTKKVRRKASGFKLMRGVNLHKHTIDLKFSVHQVSWSNLTPLWLCSASILGLCCNETISSVCYLDKIFILPPCTCGRGTRILPNHFLRSPWEARPNNAQRRFFYISRNVECCLCCNVHSRDDCKPSGLQCCAFLL